MSYDLISLNVWAPNVISIRIFLGPSISRVSGPCVSLSRGPCQSEAGKAAAQHSGLSRVLAVPVVTSPAPRAPWPEVTKWENISAMIRIKWTIGEHFKITQTIRNLLTPDSLCPLSSPWRALGAPSSCLSSLCISRSTESQSQRPRLAADQVRDTGTALHVAIFDDFAGLNETIRVPLFLLLVAHSHRSLCTPMRPGPVLMRDYPPGTNWFKHQKVVKTLNPTLVSHRAIKIQIGYWNTRHAVIITSICKLPSCKYKFSPQIYLICWMD